MPTDLLSNVSEKTKAILEPAQKMGKLTVANAEKLSQLQLETAKLYAQLGVNQMKAAVEISDAKSLQDFAQQQAEMLKTFGERLVADAKALTEMASEFNAEAQKVAKEAASAAVGKKE